MDYAYSCMLAAAVFRGSNSELRPTGLPGARMNSASTRPRKASKLLRVGLPDEWEVTLKLDESFPVVSLSGLQVEQMVLNLGLVVAANASSRPGVVHVTASRPKREHLLDVGDEFGAVIIMSASGPSELSTGGADATDLAARGAPEDVGWE